MARISLTPPDSDLYASVDQHFRRTLGVGVEPIQALAHQPEVLETYVTLERSVAGWGRLDSDLQGLAVMAAAVRVGCSWCIDYGAWKSITGGLSQEKIEAFPGWRDAPVFSECERLVLEYAEAITDTPPAVTDELVADLRGYLDEAELVQLTAIIAVENFRARTNEAFGLTSQGFKDRCEIPT
jgi:alkylhydroperoxidase family enzyme